MVQRIQQKRTKGWKMPEGAVYVGRPTKWGNWFRVERHEGQWVVPVMGGELFCDSRTEAQQVAVDCYQDVTIPHFMADPEDLRGKNLACWCPLDQPCHADVLLELANQ